MKKIFKIVLLTVSIVSIFLGCSKNISENEMSNKVAENKADKKIKIVTTIFPEYDFVREIIGEKIDNYEIVYLLDNGVDLHNFQPTVQDIAKIQSSDMFIYVGGESDAWVQNVFNNVVNKDIIQINLLDILGDKKKIEEIKEGMQDEHDDEHLEGEEHLEEEHNEEGHEEEHEHEAEYDEHVWLSVKNVKLICENLTDNISKLDLENSDIYKNNCDNYIVKLDELDKKFEEVTKNAKTKILLFGDRFPFRYLVDDYGLDYYAAFSGCSAESEASFETIIYLSKKIDEFGLKHVIKIEGSDDKIAKTIIENTKSKDQDILVMDSMQATSINDVKNGANYISIMNKNLEVLERALN